MAIEITEEQLAAEIRELVKNFRQPGGADACQAWWSEHYSRARGGDETAEYKIVGAIGALCVWVASVYTLQDAVAAVVPQEYEAVRAIMPVLLSLAASDACEARTTAMGSAICGFFDVSDERGSDDPRMLFGALITLLQPAVESGGGDRDLMDEIAVQELLAAYGQEDQFRKVWDALASQDGEMSLQMRVLLGLAHAAVQKLGHAPYPGMDVDVCSFTAFQIAAAVGHDDVKFAVSVAANFLMTAMPQDTHRLASFLASRALTR